HNNYPEVRNEVLKIARTSPSWILDEFYSMPSLRLLQAYGRLWGKYFGNIHFLSSAEADENTDTINNREKYEMICRYYERTLLDLQNRSRSSGTKLSIILIDVGDDPHGEIEQANAKIAAFLSAFTKGHGIPYFDTADVFRHCDACFLPEDGH